MTQSTRYVFSTTETTRYRFPTHTNDLIMDRAEAATSEAFLVVLEPGEAPPLHIHHDTEQVFYVLQGRGTLEIGETDPQHFAIQPRDLVRIPPHTHHRVQCDSAEPVVYLSVDCFVEGKSVDEPTWDSHVRTMCAQNGWDFDRVKQDKR